VVPAGELLDVAWGYAEQVAANAPLAVQAAKELAVRSRNMSLADGLRMEQALLRILDTTEDVQEGKRCVRRAPPAELRGALMKGPAPTGPLSDLRVLEVGAVVAGPFAARMLADLGAEVVKVEAPDATVAMRGWGRGTVDGRSLWWPIQVRNKRLVTINLRRQAGQELFIELVSTAAC
jgi:hypothetical protein